MGVRPTHAILSSISTPVLFGNKAIESSLDENAPGWAEAFPFVAGTSGTVSALTIYIDAQSQATKLIVGVYTDAHGRPGSLVASGSLSSPKAGAWNKAPVQSAAIQSGATYWAAVLGRGGTLFFRDRSFGPCTSVNSLQHSLAALPSAWTGGYTWSTCPISAYATGTTAPPSGGGTTSPPTGTAPTPVTTPSLRPPPRA